MPRTINPGDRGAMGSTLQESIFAAGGTVGALMRTIDWSATALGPADRWPQSLISTLSICLSTRFPVSVYWGPQHLLLYNDAWIPIEGGRHPAALGQPVRAVRPETWDFIAPTFKRAFEHGESSWAERQYTASSRHGYVEECYFDYGLSPIRGEGDRIVGLFMPATETTHRVLARRRNILMHAFATTTASASSVEQACVLGTEILASGAADVPFCMTYLLNESDRLAYLVAAQGFASGSPACPPIVPLAETSEPERPWPFSTALRTRQPVLVDNLSARITGPIPGGAWPEPARCAAVAPLVGAWDNRPLGFLVLGINPRRRYDAQYEGFITQVTDGMTAAIANAHGHDRERSALRARLDKIASVAPVAIFEFRAAPDGKISMPYSTPAIAQIYGHTPQELAADISLAFGLTHPQDRDRIRQLFRKQVDARKPFHDEWRVLHPTRGEIWVEARCNPEEQPDGGIVWYGYFHDITARKKMEEALRERVLTQKKRERQIRFLAYHDALTRLPNRALLLSRLRQSIAQTQRSNETLAVMFLDVDRFKTINDTLGHPAGDTLLQQIGRRLTETLRLGDTVARAGGDEFLLLVPGLRTPEDAGPVAEHVLVSLSAPFIISGQTLKVTGSVGLSVCPRDATDVESLIKYADSALYLAKEQGRNTFRFFSPDLDARVRARMHLENDLRLAVDRDEFILHYQPQIELSSNRIIGAEALIRWLHPQRGLVGPASFIPTAEDTGLILPIGEWALRAACLQARAWQETGRPAMRIAVNVSSKQLNGADIVGTVRRTLLQTACAPRLLGLEITESAVMDDPREAIRVIQALHELGIEVTIDDFGTGYSSMAYLKRFALDRLKIDAAFVRGTPEDKDDVAIVQATIALARQFRLRVTAEGVETAAQRSFLRAHHCDAIQGFLISPPLPGQDISELLTMATA
ncbi:MAG TPA: EAL domain-containing protein [Steroidobacteraceae bacterium]|nr:EAL domain-containing protein [Steroidobacteraceae bacterium]